MEKLSAYIFGPAIFASDNSALDLTAVITMPDVIESIKNGTRGLSPEIKVKWYQCTICGQNYEICNHEEGKEYDGKSCVLAPRDIEFLANSIVDTPKDPRARITDMLIVEKNEKKKSYQWHGYQSNTNNSRFKHIQNAFKNKLIPEYVAICFSNYFQSNSEGSITYPLK